MYRRRPRLLDRTSCPSETREPEEFGEWSRGANGDVRDIRSFNAHMDKVGEEDQSQPGWDAL